MKILVIGDPHFSSNLGYADYIEDRREKEKQEILDFIVSSSSDCDSVIIMGDCFHSRNPSSGVIKEFVKFIERFEDKKLYIIAGNHGGFGNGKTSIDFLQEIKNKNWEIINRDPVVFEDNNIKLSFCKYFTQAELNTKDKEEASVLVKDKLLDGDILFVHHAISQSSLGKSELTTDIFPELILPRGELEKKYKIVVGGHIHTPNKTKNTIVTGSVFCNEVGEDKKFLWKIDTDKDYAIEQIQIPGRSIYKLVDPTDDDIKKIDKNSIVKVIITKKISVEEMEELKKKLKKFDTYLYIEKTSTKRTKVETEGRNLLELDISELLVAYAKEKKIDLDKLQVGFELIKEKE